jgi:hypothetical protein
MAHCQTLATTAAKIIYTAGQYAFHCVKYWLLFHVCLDMVQYIVEQYVFLYKLCVICSSPRK